jgi:3-oxoacyl-[acyl-carrier protein] reductase
MDLGLNGRRALVTASYRGTGAGIAHVLAGEGAEVLIHGFEPDQGGDVVASIVAAGGRAEQVTGDLRSDSGVAEIAQQAGVIDVLVNNYGAPIGSGWGSMDHWADEWDVNVLTGVRLAQAVTPSMSDRGWGRVVFLGTVGIRRPGVRNAGYYGAKTALTGVVRSLAQELRGSGVTCNLVSPGMIATAEVRASVTERAARDGQGATWDEASRWALSHTMPNLTERIPDPLDIGRVVAFVASDAAWHVNGAELAVDGGAVDA